MLVEVGFAVGFFQPVLKMIITEEFRSGLNLAGLTAGLARAEARFSHGYAAHGLGMRESSGSLAIRAIKIFSAALVRSPSMNHASIFLALSVFGITDGTRHPAFRMVRTLC